MPKLLACRVDALVIAFQVILSSQVDDEIDERQSLSDLAGAALLQLGGFKFQMARNRTAERFLFENQDCRCLFDRKGASGWNLEVVLRAVFLATHTLQACLKLAELIAGAMGEILGTRLRRVDLAADYANFPLGRHDVDCLVTQRAKVSNFLVEGKDVDKLGVPAKFGEHFDAQHRVTGIGVAKGNALSARIYNKTTELALPGREEKRAIEYQLWGAAGFEVGDEVTRVEAQFRGEVLSDFKMRDPADLQSKMDGMWQYFCCRWLRIVSLTRKRRSECPDDPRWAAVRNTVFEHPSEPAKRSRERGGATAPQALGMTVARLGAIGKLPNLVHGDEVDFIKAMSPDQAEQWFKSALQTIFDGQVADCFQQLILRDGAHDAALKLALKLNAARAKYWAAPDLFDELMGPEDADRGLLES